MINIKEGPEYKTGSGVGYPLAVQVDGIDAGSAALEIGYKEVICSGRHVNKNVCGLVGVSIPDAFSGRGIEEHLEGAARAIALRKGCLFQGSNQTAIYGKLEG